MKKTDAGFIPEAWSAAKVTDTIKIAQGQVDPKKAPFDEMILVAPDHIESGTGRLTRKLTAKEQGAISGKYLFSSGDIIYSKIRPHLKKAIIADFDGLCSADMYPLTPRQGISAGYILALILGEKFSSYAESVSMRSGMPKINRTELSQYIWAVPPSGEQNAIALASSDIDALLAKLDQLIAKKRDIKQAAMQELLTRYSKPRTAGTLRDVIADLEAGVSVNSVDHENPGSTGQPCILKTSAIYDGEFNPAECKLIDTQDTNRARLSPRKDTILVSRMNTPNLVGEVGYVANDYPNLYLPDRLWMTRFHQGAKVCPRWLAYMLSSTHIKDKIKGLATGTSGSMKNISKGALLGLELAFPVLEEQIEIAMILSDMDTEITALEARREKTRLIKQGMMQELLSGRVRLI